MPNVRISDAADAGTLLASDMLPLARSGNTNAYHATMTEIAAFASTSLASGAYGNVGRNLCHNPLFNVAQRGAGPFGTAGYTLDRWFSVASGGDAASVSQSAVTDAGRANIGDEAAKWQLVNTVTGTAAAGAYTMLQQRIEDVRRLGNKAVTLSFWVAASAAGLKLGVNLLQSFGSGGSPSAAVQALASGNAITLTTGFARYSTTIAIPSTAGKTLGTNGDDMTVLQLWYSSGATNNVAAGNIGVQSGTFNLWGVQLEIGSVATPLEKPDPRYDLSNCQRFYQNVYATMRMNGPTGQTFAQTVTWPWMRAIPTATLGGTGTRGNVNTVALSPAAGTGGSFTFIATAAGDAYVYSDIWSLSADL